MDPYRWTPGRVLWIGIAIILGAGFLAVPAWVSYHRSAITPCGTYPASILQSGYFHDSGLRGQHTSLWQHLVETTDGRRFELDRPRTILAEGAQVPITLRCNRDGEPLTLAWCRAS